MQQQIPNLFYFYIFLFFNNYHKMALLKKGIEYIQ